MLIQLFIYTEADPKKMAKEGHYHTNHYISTSNLYKKLHVMFFNPTRLYVHLFIINYTNVSAPVFKIIKTKHYN